MRVESELLRSVEQFLFHEARLLDQQRWDKWLDLFTPEGVYWVPLAHGQTDASNHASLFYEDAFLRVRLGVGKPTSKEQGADHVLSRFGKRDREQMAVSIEEAADAVELILADGVEAAMNRYNGKQNGG